MSNHPNTLELVDRALTEIRELYSADSVPWVVGFSGGKDSSTVVQLVYRVLKDIPPLMRHKPVHVIASDTLVESPVVEKHLNRVLKCLREGAEKDSLPIVVEKVVPLIQDSFWVMLLGKGYPSPNRFFRWCTERLKINPTTRYIQQNIDKWGSVVIILGARKEESASRAQVLENHRLPTGPLRRHATMPQALVYAPIEQWHAEDVWSFLIANEAPWAPHLRLNSKLRELYRDAAGGECPLVIDKSTPSCGQSRFGCWTCTVVNTDSSMEGFLEVGKEYSWMEPLLQFRDKLKRFRDDPSKREKWRRNDPGHPRGWLAEEGDAQEEPENAAQQGGEMLGPFKLRVRQELLEELLQIQRRVKHTLIQPDEIELIRQHWTEDYRVSQDAMLDILERVYGPSSRRQTRETERHMLEKACAEVGVDWLALERLLDIERGYVTKLRKRGLFETLEDTIDDWIIREEGAEC